MEFPSPEKFIFETPLYEKISYEGIIEPYVLEIIFFYGKVDGPCVICNKETTYKSSLQPNPPPFLSKQLQTTFKANLNLICSRDDNYRIEIFLKVNPDEKFVIKIGQYPSIASLAKGEISKYRRILGNNFDEFSRGIGLVSHGVGIGSFVYLRRVFENLIEEAHQIANKTDNWDEEKYSNSKMNDKIQILREHLPQFLVKHSAMYGILSKGIHELTEQECLDIFPAMKSGIELILDERIRQKEQEKKENEASEAIKNIAKKISKKG